MTPYDPRQWTSHLLDIEGSLVREILGRVVASTICSTAIVLLYLYGPDLFKKMIITPTPHALVGTALGLLLVFRTNASYDRFWEGRKQWGGIVNECRNLARQSEAWLSADPRLVKELVGLTIAFPYATMHRIRKPTPVPIDIAGISAAELNQINSAKHLPLAVARAITDRLRSAHDRGMINGMQLASLDQNINLLIDYCGACERIRTTPLPFAYTVHLRRVLIVYCFTVPLALVKDFGWATIPADFLISYVLFGIEEIGVEIEDPFGYSANDLPIESFCDGIKSTLTDLAERPIKITQ